MTDGILLGTVPAGSRLELTDEKTVMAFLPDGSAKLFDVAITSKGIAPIVSTFPRITISTGKT